MSMACCDDRGAWCSLASSPGQPNLGSEQREGARTEQANLGVPGALRLFATPTESRFGGALTEQAVLAAVPVQEQPKRHDVIASKQVDARPIVMAVVPAATAAAADAAAAAAAA